MHSFLKHIEERFGLYEGTHVPLEQPMIEEAEPELNSPKRGGKKKFVVYVKNPKPPIWSTVLPSAGEVAPANILVVPT